jgi:hypothetical protein
MPVNGVSDSTFIRTQVRNLNVFTCLFLTIWDWRSPYAGSRSMLTADGVTDPNISDVQLFAALIRRKAVIGMLVAIFCA